MKNMEWAIIGLLFAACATGPAFSADEPKQLVKQPAIDESVSATAGDKAWEELKKAFIPPPQPKEWRTTPPTKDQIAEFERQNGVLAGSAADKAKEFYTKFPTHPRANEARGLELRLLTVAIELGSTNRQTELDALLEKRLSDPAVPEDEKFRVRAQRIANMLGEESTDRAANLAQAEKAVRELQRDFPKKNESYDLLLMVAGGLLEEENLQKARQITEEVARKAPTETQEQAQSQLRKLDRVGKPFELSFKDLNGKEVNVTNYAGKVVLLDFWATWCGPCIAGLPELKEIFAKYHPRGFEILGVSLDKEKDTLQKFLADEKMTWPQHFDGTGWDNTLVRNYEIEGIPTLWLIDKKGNLRNLSGRVALPAKVEKLLAE